jgi:hypothetical protein
MVVVSPHRLSGVFGSRTMRVGLCASILALVLAAVVPGSRALAQDPKTKGSHAKTHGTDKHKTKASSESSGKHASQAPEGTVAPSKPAPAETKRAQSESTETQEQMATRGPTRLDFDDRLIQGQGNKVGAVYLYDRKNLPLRSMVHQRTNFRDEIVGDTVAGAVIE